MRRKIYSLFAFMLFLSNVDAQIIFGPIIGSNLSIEKSSDFDKYVLYPNLYAGIFAKKPIALNDNLSISMEIAWSAKQMTHYNSNAYSSFTVLQQQLQMIDPSIPDISDLFDMIMGTSGININDSVYESNKGVTSFRYIEAPLLLNYQYTNFTFKFGGYFSYLISGKTDNTLMQDIPLFKVFPPSSLNSTIPMLDIFLNSLFPAMNKAKTSEINSTNSINAIDYGLKAGVSYKSSMGFGFEILYSYGFKKNIYPDFLPENKNHTTFQFILNYDLFGKEKQTPQF